MKTLYLIGGPMGVGKSAVGQCLKRMLPRAVLLDGDWCWDADPFVVTEETKRMVLSNIRFLLNSFLRCSEYENVVFCWVMHRQEIIEDILSGLDLSGCRTVSVSLTASPEALRARLERDVARGARPAAVIGRSLAYLPLYAALETRKIDTSHLDAEAAARAAAALK